MNNKIILG